MHARLGALRSRFSHAATTTNPPLRRKFTMAAVGVVPAATHGGGGGTTAVAAVPASATSLVPSPAICCIVAVSAWASNLAAYYAMFSVSLVGLARAAWPDHVDAVLGPVDAYVRRQALLALEDLEDDLRRLRDAARANRVTPPVCAGAEECARRARAAVAGWADGAKRKAVTKWAQYKDAAGAAWLVLRLLGRVVRLAGTMLLDAAFLCEEEEEEEEHEGAGFGFRGTVYGVMIVLHLLFSIRLIVSLDTISGEQLFAASAVAACGLVKLVAGWIDPPDDSDETVEGDDDDGEAITELEVSESWHLLFVLTIIAFCVDDFLLHFTLGPRPIALALLAICNFAVLGIGIGRQIQLMPDDEEGAAEGSAAAVDGAVNKWRRGAMAVFAASSVKIMVIYLALDFYLAVLSFLWLCIMVDPLLAEDDNFEELDDSGAGEDTEEGAGSSEDVNGGVEEAASDEARAEHSDTSSSEDEDEGCALEEHHDSSEEHAGASSSEDEEEGHALKEHCDISEPDCGSGSSVDDGWDLVEIDPEMPAKDNCGANRKSCRILPWKWQRDNPIYAVDLP